MVFVIECIVGCVLFTLALELASRGRREIFINDYPPIVAERLRGQGLVAEKPPTKKSDWVRKGIAAVVYAVLFALLMRYANGITTFWGAVGTVYLLWLVMDWYDFLVIDVLMAPFDKFYKLANVSAFEPSAVKFHFMASVRGMLIGFVIALAVGGIVVLL